MNINQYSRYNRHLLLKEVGEAGQKKLLDSKVLIIGVGGLGSPVSLYLGAAGVGTIGLVEFDSVDVSNLQRQILYETQDINLPKIQCAAKRIKDMNPDVNVIMHEEPLKKENALNIIEKYDFVVDATDNFATRYLINDACILLNKTYVYGSIYNFEGQVTVYGAPNGPCFRCINPEPLPPENQPGSLALGILGVVAGVIGCIQATEVIKLICNIGEPLIGRLLLYDALNMKFREVKIKPNCDCTICNHNSGIDALKNYEDIKNLEPKNDAIKKITCVEFYHKMNSDDDIVILDVSDQENLEKVKYKTYKNIPINLLRENLNTLEEYKNKEFIIICQSGVNSMNAAKALYAKGYKIFGILDGGIFNLKTTKEWREVYE
ncbi:molybdopterin-synthase adenylyltransferase MoeB [Anaerosacchariphilus polymeriproducens]|uniref:Molybdopterin-synthase adenylyltransferase MoeB n=1 Tax=Anaerosacchariphilus polymeriproducens TaxID=1812858 RepID=A0A371AXV6_9FIRM|nr:molybdopterin-synthase adenylyltransferase MoeB [Anaerosacchariphilus polymeriproducens]RDU24406.1 molybdopterin-synthase adenylyltransferase MoeB [Anaerosacchariphilus polymeriproducens]